MRVRRFLDINTVMFAFGLTLLAGLSTGIGSALAFFTKRTNKRVLSVALGFSACVMIYVSFVEIFVEARVVLGEVYGDTKGYWVTTIAFFGGIALIGLIDKFVPNFKNPHEKRDIDDLDKVNVGNQELLRMGIFSVLAIAIHNFAEGLATFTSALQDPTVGISIAIAIAIHNIPEWIAISVPLYYATGDKKKLSFTLLYQVCLNQ